MMKFCLKRSSRMYYKNNDNKKKIRIRESFLEKIKSEKGLTLIEILIAIIIIAAFASVVGPELFTQVGKSNQTAAANQIDIFKIALNNYRLDNGRYPSTEQGLEALINEPSIYPLPNSWSGPYLEKREIPKDPWGNDYQYENPGTHNSHRYDLWSYGKDGREGGSGEDADVTNW